ncbi:MAG: hypothetical protein H6Q67_2200 [Firmicutes bacterium]|nr:hypothetical protein [Bacillota bacterium]
MNAAKSEWINGIDYPVFSSSVMKTYVFAGHRGSLSIFTYAVF